MEKINYCNRKLRGKIREICDTEKDFAKMLNISSITIWISPICLEHVVPKVSKIC